ncbi:kinesin-like protein KIN-7E isoform X2 [Trifolium pratense]|uniref:kinesin-like protein KIN-7E isoform X2 n=1 Tax=Trifolium pratense TaxID=57577 RepID=UPI001E694702|nr:kinesin-like protein KIN-7E isoform X2 [Trifolium pratense]
MEVVVEEQGNTVPQNNGQEEKIYVAIRVRPLNEREKSRNDVSEWECISHNAIRFKNNGHAEQRDTYAFDRVFGEKCPTKQVYEQGIKEVALSVVRGINCSIFAYGQTSSGKTYTMTGITELAVKDIYEYIEKHKEREFVLKFSALEIYNEAVRDLLNSNATTLRLLDDPEKGTIVEKLTEETLTERSRLQQLISKCAAERTTEETAMNETSSRSHQILRLTVESNPSDFVGTARSGAVFASVNFVDLAGSERASQTLSAGTRLREGSHINRSLLTLGTVIRKLSKERNGHIPYRDSKLTRILQNSLGGNARTAVICTISPARSQVEQSKNTLFFAGCAKQVTTNARVNIVMSDKVLVKQLQKELARMEKELKSLNTTILKERELQIEQMDKEIKELTRQRDLFQNLLQSVGKDQAIRVDRDRALQWSGVANDPSSVTDIVCENLERSTSSSSTSSEHLFKQSTNSEDNFLLDGCPPTFVGPDPCQGWEEMGKRSESENNCNEVPGVEIKEVDTEHKTDNNMSVPVFEESEGNSPMIQFVDVDDKSSSGNGHSDQDSPHHKTEDIKGINNHLVDLSEKSNDSFESKTCSLAAMSPPQVNKVDRENSPHPQFGKLEQNVESSSENGHSDQDAPHKKTEGIISTNNNLVDLSKKSNDSFESEPRCLASISPPRVDKVDHENSPHPLFHKLEQNVSPPSFTNLDQEPTLPDQEELKTMSPRQLDDFEQVSFKSPASVEKEYSTSLVYFPEKLSEPKLRTKRRKSSRKSSLIHEMNASVEDVESVMDSDMEETSSVLNFVVRMNQRAKSKSADIDDYPMVPVRTPRTNKNMNREKGLSFPGVWGSLIPTKFEMQQRDIVELWDACHVPLVHRSYFFLLIKGELSDSVYLDIELRRLSFLKDAFSSGNYITGEGLDVTPNSSLTSLTHERKMLSKQVHKKFSRRGREELYLRWGIDLNTKHRSMQLAWLVWSDTRDLNHIRESAALVGKLVGFINTGEASKKTFGLGFLTRLKSMGSPNWNDTMSTL